jgi:hypothetical protein
VRKKLFTSVPLQFSRCSVLSDGRLQLEFTSFVERVAKANLLLITSEVHQVIGHYRGTVMADNGETIRIDGLIDWAEEHHARLAKR